MGKHKKWTLEDKVKIVKEFKNGATISYLNNKYGINGCGTVSRWNKEYDEGKIDVDNRDKRKQAAEEIKKYVHWYNNERIQKKLGYLTSTSIKLPFFIFLKLQL